MPCHFRKYPDTSLQKNEILKLAFPENPVKHLSLNVQKYGWSKYFQKCLEISGNILSFCKCLAISGNALSGSNKLGDWFS